MKYQEAAESHLAALHGKHANAACAVAQRKCQPLCWQLLCCHALRSSAAAGAEITTTSGGGSGGGRLQIFQVPVT